MPHYTVTSHGTDAHGRPAPAAIDIGVPQGFDLAGALAHACELLSRRTPNVAINDDNGRSISGDELVACCNGDKRLTPDLRAVGD